MMGAVSNARATGTASPPSFEEVYAACFDSVWRIAASRVPQAAVDDVVQEVFLVVHRRLGTFEGRSTVRTWVIGIARNVIRDHLRKIGHRPIGAPLEEEPVAHEPSAAELLDQKTALAVLDEALARMSDDQKEAFLLVEVEQLSSREAAEILETNDNTVRTRLRAARSIFSAAVTRFRARQRWGSEHG
jgi:RNA polymerase sigma-70 factor (ECF subfamily)